MINWNLYGGSKVLSIEYLESLDEKLGKIIGVEFSEFAAKNGVTCDYTPFAFIAKENNEVVGVITGHSYYREVHISDLIVLEKYRNKHIGSQLIETVENHCKNKGFANVNLSTYHFQAPDFYKKCGFRVEFIRENKENPKLNKYFFVKYF